MTPDLTVRDVSEALATTPETVRVLIRDGLLIDAYRLHGDRGPWRVPASALDVYRERQALSDPWVRTRTRNA
ncbi:helix-turn-helix domain-containing protein [Actinotalea sp.]|uniref:helix-turn-helix domain-containing protein n=1 Tax=Actinotalea sp. TaxID=1872145 RepID=UPI003568DB24